MAHMKIRESGMPDENHWESFFNIPLIFEKLQINSSVINLAEFGSGYGTFTLPAVNLLRELYTR